VHVLRLCSVFEPPDLCLLPPGARLDPVGGMQSHTAALTRSLDRLGVGQDVVTACRPGAARVERIGRAARIHRVGLPVRWGRQCWSAGAALLAPRLAARADLVHAHLGEDIAVLPVAVAAARLHGLPLVITVHNSVAHTLVATDRRSRRVKRLGGPIERWAVPRAAAVVTLTERLRAMLVEGGAEPGRVHVIPSGFREWEYAAGPGADPFPEAGRPRVGLRRPHRRPEGRLDARAGRRAARVRRTHRAHGRRAAPGCARGRGGTAGPAGPGAVHGLRPAPAGRRDPRPHGRPRPPVPLRGAGIRAPGGHPRGRADRGLGHGRHPRGRPRRRERPALPARGPRGLRPRHRRAPGGRQAAPADGRRWPRAVAGVLVGRPRAAGAGRLRAGLRPRPAAARRAAAHERARRAGGGRRRV
jgi:glycosyltransferase involved in cell wall biosynthesis